jgi:hypothetical protein
MLTLNGKKMSFEPWRLMQEGDVVLISPADAKMRAAIMRRVKPLQPLANSFLAGAVLRIAIDPPAPPPEPKRKWTRKDPALKAIARRRAERRAWHRAHKPTPAINPFS